MQKAQEEKVRSIPMNGQPSFVVPLKYLTKKRVSLAKVIVLSGIIVIVLGATYLLTQRRIGNHKDEPVTQNARKLHIAIDAQPVFLQISATPAKLNGRKPLNINLTSNKIAEEDIVKLKDEQTLDFACYNTGRPSFTANSKVSSSFSAYLMNAVKDGILNGFNYLQIKQSVLTARLSIALKNLQNLKRYIAYHQCLEKFYNQGSRLSFKSNWWPWLKNCCSEITGQVDLSLREMSLSVATAQQRLLDEKLNPHTELAETPSSDIEVIVAEDSTEPALKVTIHQNDQSIDQAHLDSIYKILNQIKIYSVRVDRTGSRVNLNGQICYPHTLISENPKVKFMGVDKSELIFCDEYKQEFRKKIDNND